MYLYHLQLLFLYFLSCFLAFSLFKFINGEGPGILGVFLDLTSEFTYLLNNDRSSKYIDHHFCQPTLYPCVVYLRYHQGCHCHSISSFPRAGCFQLLHSQNWRKEPKLPFKDLNLIFSMFFLNKEISRIQLQLDRLIIPRLGKNTTRKWVCSTFLFLYM